MRVSLFTEGDWADCVWAHADCTYDKVIAIQNPGKYIVRYYASECECVSAEIGNNASADKRSANCTIVERAYL